MRREIDYVSPDSLTLTETVVKVNRSAKVMKGGRRFGFSALVVVGNHEGVVGVGFGKANEVPPAVEKAVADAKKRLVRVPVVGTTLPHATMGRYRSSSVKLIPAAPGTGVIAGQGARAILEAAGVKDVLTKAYGSTNAVNLVKAAFEGLMNLRTRDQVARARGVELR
ncbi:MAG: 30S ribosomal protein S5 [Planctomycetes bacterium]|nr:30S ribosomal protein S5 [Planctomycetota bacterium]